MDDSRHSGVVLVNPRPGMLGGRSGTPMLEGGLTTQGSNDTIGTAGFVIGYKIGQGNP
jgi:hypothetical protein